MKIISILACLLCLTLGIFVGLKIAPKEDTDVVSTPSDEPTNGTSAIGKKKTLQVHQVAGGTDAQTLSNLLNTDAGRGSKAEFFTRLDELSADELVKMISDLETAPNSAKNSELQNHLTNYLAVVDPLRALDLKKNQSTVGIFKDAFRQLGRQDPAAALTALSEWESPERRATALKEIVEGAAETDPARTFDLIKDMPELRNGHVRDLFKAWSQTNPQLAAQQALTLKAAGARSAALKEIGDQWAEQDPDGALNFAKSADLSGPEKQQMISETLKSYAKTNPAEALTMLGDLDLLAKNKILPKVMSELMTKDPNAALEYIDAQDDPYTRRRLMDKIAVDMAGDDPESFIQLAAQIPELKSKGLPKAVGKLAGTDFSAATASLSQFEDDPNYEKLIKEVAKGGADYHSQEALQWAQTLGGESRIIAINTVIEELSERDPQGAAVALEVYTAEGAGSNDTYKAIAETWAATDPAGAASWAYTLPEGEAREDALRSIAGEWTKYDPVTASSWISELPEGGQRDNAAKELINVIRKDDPEAAFLWAQSINDETDRGDYIQKAYKSWSKYDEASAKAAISGADIPFELKQELLGQ